MASTVCRGCRTEVSNRSKRDANSGAMRERAATAAIRKGATLRSDSRAGTNSAAAAPKSAAWLRSKRRHRRRAQAASAAATMKKGMLSGSATSTARHSATPYDRSRPSMCGTSTQIVTPSGVRHTAATEDARTRAADFHCDRAAATRAARAPVNAITPSMTPPCRFAHAMKSIGTRRQRSRVTRTSRVASSARLITCGRTDQSFADGIRTRRISAPRQRAGPVITRQTRTQARSAIEAAKAASAGIPPTRHSP